MTTHHADIELLAGCLRVFRQGSAVGVDPYEMAATLHWIDQQTVEIKGTTSSDITSFISMRAAICEALAKLGVETMIFRRKRTGRPDQVLRIDTTTNRKKR